jgi:penicillin-binding protein 1A
MNNMTGGTLPAGTWHDIMAYAHQGATLKPIVGLRPDPKGATAAANANVVKPLELGAPQRPATLSKGAIQALESIQTKIKAVSGDKQSALEAPEPAASDDVRREAQRARGAVGGVIR